MLTVSTNVLDFGTIKQTGPKWKGVVEVTNISNNQVKDVHTTASCGCTRPSLPSLFEPNQSHTMEVVFDPSGKSGNILKTITIMSAGQNPIQIKLKGVITK